MNLMATKFWSYNSWKLFDFQVYGYTCDCRGLKYSLTLSIFIDSVEGSFHTM